MKDSPFPVAKDASELPIPETPLEHEVRETRRNINFREELECLINRCSLENQSNTPDFILSEYIWGCLQAFTQATKARESWYGKSMVPAQIEIELDSRGDSK